MQIKNIVSSNAQYLDRSENDIQKLISKMKETGFTTLNILFDGNPYILNLDDFEIENYIENRAKEGEKVEETDKNYNKLFINQKQFQNAYGITKEELLEKYDYQAYIQQKKIQDLGKETLEIQKDTPYIQQTEQAMNNQKQMLGQKNQDGVNID